jgi:putative copper resistance protein D
VAVVALCGGPATYSRALVSVQVGQLLVLLLVVPVLLSLGQPLRLAQQARAAAGEPRRVVRVLADPVNGLLLALGLVAVLYASPLLESSLRSASVHLLVNVLALTVGCLFWWPVLGHDRVPRLRPRRDRVLLVVVLLAVLLAFGWGLRTAAAPLGGTWFAELGWLWSDPVADQRAGAVVVWVAALGCALFVLLAQLASEFTSRAKTGGSDRADGTTALRTPGRPVHHTNDPVSTR